MALYLPLSDCATLPGCLTPDLTHVVPAAILAGMWPLHCHVAWHAIMGQRMYVMEGLPEWTAQPAGFPKCATPCIYDFAPFDQTFVNGKFGDSGFEVPP